MLRSLMHRRRLLVSRRVNTVKERVDRLEGLGMKPRIKPGNFLDRSWVGLQLAPVGAELVDFLKIITMLNKECDFSPF